MGLIAFDIAVDAHCHASGSSSISRFANRPAIHLVIPDAELIKQKFSLFQGSGGKLMPYHSSNQSGGNVVVTVPTPNNLVNAVREICNFFGLSKLELTQVLKLQSRKSLYNWLNGETVPRKSTMDRVFDLLIITRALKSSGFSSTNEHMHNPVIGRASMLDLLKETEINQERIIFAASRLQSLMHSNNSLSDPFA